MIATISFALLAVIAVGYVLAPLIFPATPEPPVCRSCGARVAETMKYCAGCGRAV